MPYTLQYLKKLQTKFEAELQLSKVPAYLIQHQLLETHDNGWLDDKPVGGATEPNQLLNLSYLHYNKL